MKTVNVLVLVMLLVFCFSSSGLAASFYVVNTVPGTVIGVDALKRGTQMSIQEIRGGEKKKCVIPDGSWERIQIAPTRSRDDRDEAFYRLPISEGRVIHY